MDVTQRTETGIERLICALGYSFCDEELLFTALTHTSFVKGDGRRAGSLHNERLEFLGDAVLELVVSDRLYRSNPRMQEGDMTKARARLVCEQSLYRAACALGVPEALRLGHGEEVTGGREKPSIVSDALEALIGAIYVDGGMDAACAFISSRVIRLLEEACVQTTDKDYKTRLQELVQKERNAGPEYVLVSETGPEHKKEFTMRVLLGGEMLGEGSGASKQAAGQEAARAAIEKLNAQDEK